MESRFNYLKVFAGPLETRNGTIIETGASRGIGAGVVRAFLERGYNVVANSRNINSSGTFRASEKLALVDGNIGESAVAAKMWSLRSQSSQNGTGSFTHS